MIKPKRHSQKRVFRKKDFMLPKTKVMLRIVGTRMEHKRMGS